MKTLSAMKKLFLMLSLCFFFYGCPLENFEEPKDSNILFINNSNIDLYCTEIIDSLTRNDLTSFESRYIYLRDMDSKIDKNSTMNKIGSFKRWVENSPSKKIEICLFSRDTILKLPLDEIVRRKLYLKKIELNMNNISNNVWTVLYP